MPLINPMDHQSYQPYDDPVRNQLAQWLLGVSNRVQHPLEAAAQASNDMMNQSPVSTALNWMGGGIGMVGSIKNIGEDIPKILERNGQPLGLLNTNGKSIPNSSGIFDTIGLPNRGRELIQNEAENLAEKFKSEGFDVIIDHSGSAAGPSSYLSVSDPQTGRFIVPQIRLSGHSKGVKESQGVWNVAGQNDYEKVLQIARDMRAQGPSAMMRQQLERNGQPIAPQVDPLLSRAKEISTSEGRSSVPLIMRNLNVDRLRAQQLVDAMQAEGHITPRAHGQYDVQGVDSTPYKWGTSQ